MSLIASERRAISLAATGWPCPVTARALLPDQLQEKGNSMLLPLEVMDHHLALRADPSPPPRQAWLAEQVGLDGQAIEARHVSCAVLPLEIEMI
ncbi:hypothetical protein FHW37_11929 [Neorhizobium alkalisoli]|uniref:Uncharacterized protein n=1 Tax=Neorhizobium alkalisoli TaxID=528178 RepID=A0A561PZB8_9HYPH|nr:hypothetical protein FHW37_11929 [Neorhizobium alkalisoli]